MGYQKDVAAAVVFQASSQLRKTYERLRRETTGRQQLWERAWQDGLLGSGSVEQLSQEEEGCNPWAEAVRISVVLWQCAVYCAHSYTLRWVPNDAPLKE